jgi:RNA polymerase sigma-70 factor (ECF subfamily)
VRGAVLPSPTSPKDFATLEPERRFLWGVCYRMTGSASDADDLVQETFVRAIERPPPDTSAAWRPWLVRVAMNLARDQLRRRKRRDYHGVWLPSPIETADDDAAERAASPDASPEARYGLRESASFAFLVAVEVLTESQRAVLLLRDVFDYSSSETAEMLEISEENARIILHRARKAMAAYDGRRRPPSPESHAVVEAALHKIVACLATRDVALARHLFAEDTQSIGDGGGVYHAAPRPVVGAEKVLKVYSKLASLSSSAVTVEIRTINDAPALVVDDPAPKRPNAPRVVVFVELDENGLVCALYSVIAPEKLSRIRFRPRESIEARGG